MSVRIEDGLLKGTLKDDTGKEWPIVHRIQAAARGPLAPGVPDLCLHTTETDTYLATLEFPSQWQTGQGVIGQHIKLGLSGDAVNLHDNVLQQIEMVGRSEGHVSAKWLPKESTLGPTVALVAWLHRTGRIRTGLKRPNPKWPVVLDRGPQAVTSYYRRNDGTWGTAGVYGHVEIPDNDHYDPGSFDYPAFFARVEKAIAVQDPPKVVYRVGAKVFHGLSRALRYVKKLLKKGKDATVRVVTRR